jgi:hypothetical protein
VVVVVLVRVVTAARVVVTVVVETSAVVSETVAAVVFCSFFSEVELPLLPHDTALQASTTAASAEMILFIIIILSFPAENCHGEDYNIKNKICQQKRRQYHLPPLRCFTFSSFFRR